MPVLSQSERQRARHRGSPREPVYVERVAQTPDEFWSWQREALEKALKRPLGVLQPESAVKAGVMGVAMGAPWPVGDLVGMGLDVDTLVTDPSSRNLTNYALMAAGALPLVPSMTVMRKAGQGTRKLLKEYKTKALHGSTHDIRRFNAREANPESDWGRGVYSTTSADDVSINYAGQGPDLSQRIDLESERIADAMSMDDYVRDELLEEHGFSLADYEADEAAVVQEIAKKSLVGEAEGGVVYPLQIDTSDYAIVGGKNATRLDEPDYYDMARKELSAEDYADEWEFEDAVFDRASELRAEDPQSLENRIHDALKTSDIADDQKAIDDVMMQLYEDMMDGSVTATDIDYAIRRHVEYGIDDLEGNLIPAGAISGQVLENLGFKGVVDNTVNAKFGNGRNAMGMPVMRGMAGVDASTQHIVTFPGHENTIRSRFAKFDPEKADSTDILAAHPIATAVGASLAAKVILDREE